MRLSGGASCAIDGLDDDAPAARLVLRPREACSPLTSTSFDWLQFKLTDLHEIHCSGP